MKNIKYVALTAALTIILSACDQKRDKATLGGTQDTAAVAGSAKGSSAKSTDTSKIDSTNKGNANPSGQMGNDTTKTPH